ncbi:MAG TPA: IclR family transcriptional regulator C-terminal domain-containing protein [Methylibium sp.]|uniref:IclR family transcriptional regulator domain-containing protein n=1 Tax=Methylibium sp. TaxID=2067992 RepID=UPI002DBCE086|nr:IclR family transcriptional regulator C-terminal domain-containing protein [Methylibium sp.]HEU4457596.1 IclR family transcriptional regulator C-terminal domain-containing protein [Methylibium sp.]
MDSPARIDPKDLIEGLGKGLRVIEAFDDDHPRLSPSETAHRTGLTRTAARRYLLSLVHFGYAATDGKLFWLLPRVLRLGQSYLGTARLPRLVQPFIQRVSMACGETVNVSVLDGHEVIYIARSNSPRVVSIGYQVGARIPAHVVAPGVVILASLRDDALDAWCAEHEFAALSPHTVTDATRFRSMVSEARTLGHWISEQYLDTGLRGIAVALKNRHGQCQGAVGVTLPIQPLTREQVIDRMLPLLNDVAQSLRPLI